MKNFGLIIIAMLMLASCNQVTEQGDSQPAATIESATDGVFIHITQGYDDPHRVLMPLKMATMMANDKDVLVYMDIDAVNLLVKGAKDLEYKDFESCQTYLKKLAEMNVGVYACPTCLQVAGFGPGDLMEGIQTAQKDKFFNFTEGRIITLDY